MTCASDLAIGCVEREGQSDAYHYSEATDLDSLLKACLVCARTIDCVDKVSIGNTHCWPKLGKS